MKTRNLLVALLATISISASAAAQAPAAEAKTGAAKTSTARRDLDLGLSCLKRQIRASVFGAGKRGVLVLGAVHGDEPASATLAEAFIASLEKVVLPSDVTVVVVPTVNPDGLKANTRYNGCGVDVNRNFPTKSWQPAAQDARHNPGKRPASEPETRLIIDLVERYKPELIVSIHAPLHCVNWDGPAESFAGAIAGANGYELKASIGYPTPGSLGAYAGIERRIPAVTLELPPTSSDETIRLNVLALHAALKHLAAGVETKAVAAPASR